MNNYIKLLEKIEEYKKTKFWTYIDGDDIFKIKGYKNNIYVSIMGNAKIDYGIAIYNGEEELFTQLDTTFGEYREFPDIFNRVEMYKIQLFDVGHLLNNHDKKKLTKNKIKSKDHAFKLESGYLPRVVDEDECQFIMDVLDDIILIAGYIYDVKLKMIEQEYIEKMYAFDIKDGVVKHSKINYPTKQNKKIKIEKINSSIINKLLMTRQQGIYHIGLFYSPVFVTEERNYYPLMLFIVEEHSGLILGLTLIKREEISTVANKIGEIFAKNHLVPENICFSDSSLVYLCEELLVELKVRYIIDNTDELLFDIWEGICKTLR